MLSLFVLLNVAHLASAWSLTWTNEDGKSYIEHQSDPVECRKIEQAEGQSFRWQPEEDGLSIWLFENDRCAGYRAGYSPPTVWNHPSASRDLLSFRVASEDEDEDGESSTSTSTSNSTTTTSTSTETETSTSTTTTTSPTPTSTESISSPTSSTMETPTGGPSDSDSSDDSSVPAGAIAGGVVGGIAGVALIGGLFFFLGRRKRSSINPAPRESGPNNGSDTESRPATAPAPTSPAAPTPMYGAAAAGAAPYDPSFLEGKPELDSSPVYQRYEHQANINPYADEIVKQPCSPLDVGRPPAMVMAELQGDDGMLEMSDSHRLNELEGDRGVRKS
ncbi:hypothetical protein BDV12DRAFT_198932 [Aspergillus spectabilis]